MSSLPPLSHVLPLPLSSSSSSSSFSLYQLRYFKIPLLAIPFSSKLPRSLSLSLLPSILHRADCLRPFSSSDRISRQTEFFLFPEISEIFGIDSLKIDPLGLETRNRKIETVIILTRIFNLCLQPSEEFNRLNEPLQTVATGYCPTSYPVTQSNTEEKLHPGKCMRWISREEQVWGTVSWQQIFSDIPFRLYHDKSFREVGKVERAIPSGSPSPRFSSSLIRDVSLESARRLSSVTRSRLGYVFVVNTYLHEARFHAGTRKRSGGPKHVQDVRELCTTGEKGEPPPEERLSPAGSRVNIFI